MALRAQGYTLSGQEQWHNSSAYYITLHGAGGENLNEQYAKTQGAIGAFLGGELRGVSQVLETPGGRVFLIRVWGDENDGPTATLRLHSGYLEYEVGTLPFKGDGDNTYGEPSNPLEVTVIPAEEMVIDNTSVTVLRGSTQTVTASLLPENHSAIVTPLSYVFSSSDTAIFTVENDGPVCTIKGVALGQGTLTAKVVAGERTVFQTGAHVSVTTDAVHVSGIESDGPTDLTKTVGDQFQLKFVVKPENATNRRVEYTVGDLSILNIIQENETAPATFVAVKAGQTTITVRTVDGGYTLTYNVTVEDLPTVHVESITVDPASVEIFIDETFNFSYTVLPADAADKSVDIAVEDESIVQLQDDGSYKGLKAGTTRIVVTSRDNPQASAAVSVTVKATVPVTIAFSAGDVVLSKLRDAAITLTATEPAKVNPAKVELVFPDHANNGWGAVGTATKTDASGLRWSARANYVGNYTLRIRYNGELQASTCNVHVPAEYALQNGWQWMSFYAVGAAGEFNPQSATLFIDDDNFVSDIRTQQAVLHYDPDYNYFGDLTRLAPADGFFKVFTHTDDDHDGQLLLNLGYTNLLTGQSLPQRQAAPGYTWLTYPHELSHQLTTLAPYLAQTAAEGDMIIGQDDFAEFDGDNWQADDSFILEAGKGYIYYTESTQPKTVNWGPATLAPEVMGNMPARVEDKMVTDLAGTACVASAYPDVMPIVARIDNALLTEGTTVIAMVDGMARAAGRMTPDGLIHLAVAGTTGQVVSFALADTDGNTVPLPLQLPFATRAGSHSSPVELSVASVAVSQQQTEQNFDLQGRRITEQRSSLQHGVYFINGKKVIK